MPDSYRALALQLPVEAVNQAADASTARGMIARALDRLDSRIGAARAWIGPDLKLVVCPEYFLTGFPLGESFGEWIDKACLDPDGPEYSRLGEIASRHDLYLAGNGYETDPHFPSLYFQTSFVIAPSGEVVLRYRRINSMFAPTPHDVWEQYLEVYGYEAVFPVAHTEIGVLGCIASEEILYPEHARALALQGVEVLCHSTSEPGGDPNRPKEIAKRARAIESLAYLVSANTGGIDGTPILERSVDGGSKLVDPNGRVLIEAGSGPSIAAFAEVDLASVRRLRRRVSMDNLLARQRLEPFRAVYDQSVYPAGTLSDGPALRTHFKKTLEQTIARLETDRRI